MEIIERERMIMAGKFDYVQKGMANNFETYKEQFMATQNEFHQQMKDAFENFKISFELE